MDRIFITVLNMSITASCVLAVVLVLRLVLRRMGAPGWAICLLWAVVFFRLLCPVAWSSDYSLLQFWPQQDRLSQSGAQMEYVAADIYVQQLPVQEAQPIGAERAAVQPAQREAVRETAAEEGLHRTGLSVLALLPLLWLGGVLLSAAYSGWRWYDLRRQVATATQVEGQIYESDRVGSPFVMGLLKPKIYLPLGLAGQARDYIVLHEQCHIRRGDLWWKAMAQAALVLHWFNPLVYGAYGLLEQDLERACDEKVIARLGSDSKADYSRTLLAMSAKRSHLLTPLAFGESRTRQRVQHILQYAKPTAGLLLVCMLIGAMVAVSCLSNPTQPVTAEDVYQQSSRQSMFYQSYYLDLQPDLQAVYEIVMPDDPLQLRQMVSYVPKGVWYSMDAYEQSFSPVRSAEERSGDFHFSTNDHEQFQRHQPQLEQYMRVAMALLEVERAGATVVYPRDERSDVSSDFHVEVTLEHAPQSQDELQQLLEQWQMAEAEQRAAQLWPYAEHMRSQERQMLAVRETFPFYDVLSQPSLSYNFNLSDSGTYSVEFCVDERDAYLREQKKSRLDYEKSAILIFAQNPQLSEIEFRFLGNQLNWGVGYTNETVYFRRDELERWCGPLAFTAHGTLEEQAQVWFAKAETAGLAEPGGQPVLEFDEKLRRLEWYYDDEKSKAHYDKNETYLQLRFSLLPDKAPDDGGCYLQMEFVQPDGELRTAERNTSAIWIYGEQARWQQLTAPTAVQKEAHAYGTAREILCSGEYQIVVSRWDKQLRAGLEALGGQIVEEQSTPWSVVYKGTLVFQQQIP